MVDADAYLAHRVRRMPEMLETTRRKLVGLHRECERYGLCDLLNESRRLTADEILTDPEHVSNAWDREVIVAKMGGDVERGS